MLPFILPFILLLLLYITKCHREGKGGLTIIKKCVEVGNSFSLKLLSELCEEIILTQEKTEHLSF